MPAKSVKGVERKRKGKKKERAKQKAPATKKKKSELPRFICAKNPGTQVVKIH